MRVLASPATSNRRGNPYNWLLYTHMRELGVVVDEFSWNRLLAGGYDIWHMHWPESTMGLRTAAAAAIGSAKLFAMMATARRLNVKMVWTIHNIEEHEKRHPTLSRWFWRAFTARVDGCINLSAAAQAAAMKRFPSIARLPHFVVPHGFYREAYPDTMDRASARAHLALPSEGRIVAFVGQIRAYKKVGSLVDAFCRMDDPHATLLVAGDPRPHEEGAAVRRAAAKDRRLRISLRFLSDGDLLSHVKAADLLVYPSQELNSGSLMLALSFGRPVLVQANGPMLELRAALGEQWVLTYEGRLTPDVLRDSLDRVTNPRPTGLPCLETFAWSHLAAQTLDAYCQIIAPRS